MPEQRSWIVSLGPWIGAILAYIVISQAVGMLTETQNEIRREIRDRQTAEFLAGGAPSEDAVESPDPDTNGDGPDVQDADIEDTDAEEAGVEDAEVDAADTAADEEGDDAEQDAPDEDVDDTNAEDADAEDETDEDEDA